MRPRLERVGWLAVAALACSALTASANTVHTDSPSFPLDTRLLSGTASGDSGVFVFDTRGNEALNTASLSNPFPLDTRNPTLATPVVMSGRVTGPTGIGLANVTVTVLLGQTVVAQVVTDLNGNYQLPPLSSLAYVLRVSVPGYATAARALTLNSGAATQNFQLVVLPAAPATQQTTRVPPTSFTQPPVGPMGETLKVFDGSQFVPITAQNTSPDRMTIVLTHGWQSNPVNCDTLPGINGWPREMAEAMWNRGITTSIANIVAWDWLEAAQFEGAFKCHLPPAERTSSQGAALGARLWEVLGANYSKQTHFLGHSLGTMVNAAAINYLHRHRIATLQQPVAPTAWAGEIHVTLFDHAEAGYWVDWTPQQQPPMPVSSTWADAYVSLVSDYQSRAVNVTLQKGPLFVGPNPASLHGYPMRWYRMSIADPTDVDNPLGFRQTYEYRASLGLPNPDFLPPSSVPVNSSYHQSPWTENELALEPSSSAVNLPFGIVSDFVVQGTVEAIQTVGSVAATVWDATQAAGQTIVQGFQYAGSVAAQAGQTVVNILNSPVLRLNLRIGPGFLFQQEQGKLLQSLAVNNVSSSSESNTQAMAWLPIQIPTNATVMAFDFVVAGDPVDDVLVCGIETNNLFSLEAKYIPTNTVSASRLIDVSAWAGTTNELFFGLMGGTSTNAELQIDNIRFYSLQKYPRGDVNGDLRVTGSDSLLINQVMVGLRSTTSSIFQTTTFFNGDVNNDGTVSGADSLLINQTLVGLRPYLVTEILPGSHSSNQTTAVTIYGVGFPTNSTPSVSIGAPVTLTLTNVVVINREQITALVPAGGTIGTGIVNVIYASTNGVMSFGRFINQ